MTEENIIEEDFFATLDAAEAEIEGEENLDDKDDKGGDEEDRDLFAGAGSEDSEENGDTPNLLKVLVEKGYFDADEDETFDNLSEEEIEDKIEEKFEKVVEERIKELISEIPTESKEVVEYLLKGGDLYSLTSLVSNGELSEDLDISEEASQVRALKFLLTQEGEDPEVVDANIEFYKSSGRLEVVAKKKYDKYLETKENAKKETLKAVENRKAAERQKIKENIKEASDFINKTEALGELTIIPADKKVLPKYMYEKSVKLENGAMITPFYSELFYEVMQNKTAAAQLAVLIKNRNKDGTLDFSRIERSIKTKEAKRINENLRRTGSTIPGGTSGSKSNAKKGLAELLKS